MAAPSGGLEHLPEGVSSGQPGAEALPASVIDLEERPGPVHVGIDLPVATQLAVLAPVELKAFHVLRGIAQEQPDLMGKVPALPKALPQPVQQGLQALSPPFTRRRKRWEKRADCLLLENLLYY